MTDAERIPVTLLLQIDGSEVQNVIATGALRGDKVPLTDADRLVHAAAPEATYRLSTRDLPALLREVADRMEAEREG
ncbi:hypothetical protein SEA_JEFE_84 [Microbacterium phage Jefe]|uniref:Tail assembly chaperone n=2 Tax=Quhwahvirus TaxID=2733202 RepID=A0AAE7WVL4_9CAUD|nr:hypothetical protein QDA06_gp83 [Microbacterium phage Shotgun]QDP45478.1 hypothetical protein SEA_PIPERSANSNOM_85 [Microbacterium phage PiperSansNom]QXN74876.1 hypothetical protein SEA_PHRANCESCO_84 [Microbacterium phage Phrancesco]UVK58656.1 hypothetical protein SEA_CRAZYRICH_82 [Microbacterium phage CrazyRich]WBF79232.1 hypothetical protein SEA_JEFE_84 [Microbacterium phage Jefe]QYW07539.1 hypothetical protein SEA_SHOTGUN_83 [Microbacterium phage Shotgun]